MFAAYPRHVVATVGMKLRDRNRVSLPHRENPEMTPLTRGLYLTPKDLLVLIIFSSLDPRSGGNGLALTDDCQHR